MYVLILVIKLKKTCFLKIIDYNVFNWKEAVAPKDRWVIECRSCNHHSSGTALLTETLDIVKSSNVRKRAAAKCKCKTRVANETNMNK